MSTILVTGGAGYIGSIFVEELVKRNYQVIVLDNFYYNQASLNHLCKYDNLEIVNGDIRNINDLKSSLKRADIIFPLASLVGAPLCEAKPLESQSVNFDSIKLLLTEISKNQSIIMPTTNSAYGSGKDGEMFTEKSKLNPISNYAIQKVEVEKMIMNHGNSISFRLATVFGMSPRMRIDLLVNDFVYRAVNDSFIILFESHFKRNYIHVRDVSNAFIFALENYEKLNNNIFNLGLSDANLSKRELCDSIKKFIPNFVINEETFKKDKDQRNYIISNEKIENIGYKTNISLDKGILELIKGYKMLKNRIYGNY